MTKPTYTEADRADVLDNPEWTPERIAAAVPFAEAFPDLAKTVRRVRGPQKAPTKTLISLRISPDVLDRFRKTGRGWQARMDDALRKAVGL